MTTKHWWFLIPPSLVLVGVLILKQSDPSRNRPKDVLGKDSSNLTFIYGALSIVSIVLARILGEFNFGYFWRSYDQLFRSAIASGLYEWGANDNIVAAGTPLRYHWLAEAACGLIAKLSGSPTIDVVTKFAPLLFTCAACAALFSHAKRLGLSLVGVALTFGSTLWLSGSFSTFSSLSPRRPLAFALLFMFLGVLHDYQLSVRRLKFILLIALLCPLILLTDTFTGIVLCVTVSLISLIDIVRRQVASHEALLLIAIGPLSIFLMRISILQTDPSYYLKTSLSLSHILQFGKSATNIYGGESLLIFALVSLAILCAQSLKWVGLYGAQNLGRLFQTPHVTCWVPAIAGLILANTLGIGHTRGDAMQVDFLLGMFALPLLSADAITRDFRNQRHGSRFWINTLVSGVILGFIFRQAFVLERWNNTRLALPLIMTIPVIVLAAITVIEWVSKRSARQFHQRSKIARQGLQVLILVALFTSSGLESLVGAKELTKPIKSENGALGTAAQLECLTWIRENTPKSAIVVSTSWEIPIPSRDEKYFMVSNFTERRVLIDGPLYVYMHFSKPSEEDDRITWSKEFIDTPTKRSYEYMKSKNVSVAFVDFQTTNNRTLDPYATTVFKNEGCFVGILK